MKALLLSCIILSCWWIISSFSLVSPLFLPHPLDVIGAFRMELVIGSAATVSRTIAGFVFGIGLAYLIHLLSVVFKMVDMLDAQFAASRAVPAIALMPLFLLWFGFGEIGRIVIVTLTAALFFLAPLHEAYKILPREWTILHQQLELSSVKYYASIIVPGTVASLLGAYRLTLAISFTIAIAGDYMGAQIGIGKFIDTSRVTFNVPGIFLAIVAAAVIGLGLDRFVLFALNSVVHWGGRTVKA